MKNFRATKLLPTAVLITMLLFSGSKANAEGLTLYETLKQTDKDPYSYDMSANENVTQDLGDYGKNSNNFTINGNNHQIIGNAHTGIEPSDQNLFIHNVNNTGDMSTATSGMSGFNKALALYGWGRTISSIITNSIFNDNNNNTSEGLGGAISMGGSSNSGSTNLTITNAVFKNNTATNYGGAIFVGKNSKVTLENVKFIDNKANGLAKDIINEGTLIFKNDLATDSLTTNITNRGGTYAGLGTVEFENTTMDFKEYPFILIDQGLSIDPHSKVTATAEQLQGLRYVENKGEFIFSAGSEDNLYGIELWGSGATTFTADSYITNKSGKNFGGDLGTIINQGYLELISNGPRGTIKNDNILKLKFLGTTTDNTIKLYAIIAGTGETIIPTGYSIDNNLKTIKQNKLTIEQDATAILKLDNITADIVNDGSITVAYRRWRYNLSK